MNNKITVFRKIIYFIISFLIATFIFVFVRQSIDNNYTNIEEENEIFEIEKYNEIYFKIDEYTCDNNEIKLENTFNKKEPILIENKIDDLEDNNTSILDTCDLENIEEISIEEDIIDENSIEITTRSINNISENVSTNSFTEEEIDMITNVVMHEVGGIYGSESFVTIAYANGYSETYYGTCMIHKIHTQVLLNQYYSSMFPSSLSKCISWYWDVSLTNTNYYNKSNSTWQHCRNDVIDVITNGSFIPSNVYGATCDPYFAQTYAGYCLYAAIYWNTGWCSGNFYYYQYIG